MSSSAMRIGLLLASALLALAPPANGAPLVFNTSQSQFIAGFDNQGFWAGTQGGLSSTVTNYQTGFHFGSTVAQEYRSFFTFNLASLNLAGQAVTAATLRLRRFGMEPENGTSIALGLWDVTTPAATLNNNVGTNAAIFADIGGGTSYGQFIVPFDGNADANSTGGRGIVELVLNANALSDIANAAGGFFSIGGRVTSTGEAENLIFSSSFGGTLSGGDEIQQLVVELGPAPTAPAVVLIAEPAALAAFGAGLAVLVLLLRSPRWRTPAPIRHSSRRTDRATRRRTVSPFHIVWLRRLFHLFQRGGRRTRRRVFHG
jgi:hypothetical protein